MKIQVSLLKDKADVWRYSTHYNVVNGRTHKNHNKYTRPPTLEPNTT